MDYRKRKLRRHTFNVPGDAHELTFSCYHRSKFLNAERTCLWLAEAINEVRCGKLDPKVANSMGYLAGILLHGLEQGPVEERLARLEASLGLAAKTSRLQSELGMPRFRLRESESAASRPRDRRVEARSSV